MSGPIPILLLTGSLGSGKTTFLNRLLRRSDMSRTYVILNETGDIAIDHDLVERVSGDSILLQGGCVCCTARSDLIDLLRALFQKRVRGQVAEFDRVIIETAGSADPAAIRNSLTSDPVVGVRFRFESIVVTIDARVGAETPGTSPEAAKQISLADRLMLTKTDLVDAQTVNELKKRLHQLNPKASILTAVGGL